jgi:hypothetical protein
MEQRVPELVSQSLHAVCWLQASAHSDTPAAVRAVTVRLVLKSVILDGEVDATSDLDQLIVSTEWVVTRQTGADLWQWVALRLRDIENRGIDVSQ